MTETQKELIAWLMAHARKSGNYPFTQDLPVYVELYLQGKTKNLPQS